VAKRGAGLRGGALELTTIHSVLLFTHARKFFGVRAKRIVRRTGCMGGGGSGRRLEARMIGLTL